MLSHFLMFLISLRSCVQSFAMPYVEFCLPFCHKLFVIKLCFCRSAQSAFSCSHCNKRSEISSLCSPIIHHLFFRSLRTLLSSTDLGMKSHRIALVISFQWDSCIPAFAFVSFNCFFIQMRIFLAHVTSFYKLLGFFNCFFQFKKIQLSTQLNHLL